MVRNIEAIVEKNGSVRLLEKIELPVAQKAIVTILDQGAVNAYRLKNETAFISEPSLAADWNRPEEDEAWLHLQ